MVILSGIRDAKRDHHLVEKWRLGERMPQGSKVRRDMEGQRVAPGSKGGTFQQGRRAASIRVGLRSDRRSRRPAQLAQLDAHTRRRSTGRNVQYMGCQRSHRTSRSHRLQYVPGVLYTIRCTNRVHFRGRNAS